jgi:Zn-finger nucleic acid-binding protein/endogenous inhibitor of DNA gyrase (YacG/DUF329 family)
MQKNHSNAAFPEESQAPLRTHRVGSLLTSQTTKCPSCNADMAVHPFAGMHGRAVELDLCFACHGMWFDPQENLKLAPAGVVELFKLLHAHREEARTPLALKINCPRCQGPLTQGFDVVTSGRYITYRCPRRHGRFSAFSSFMIEKGFVRLLTRPEIDDIAQRVAVISCTGCGAPVDLRKDHACPHCRSAFSLLDPEAVERALHGYKTAANGPAGIKLPELADALVMLERDRLRALADRKKERGTLFDTDVTGNVNLWAIGIALVAKMLD